MKKLAKTLILVLITIALIVICTGEAFSQNSLVDNKEWKSSDTPAEVKIRLELKDNIAKLIIDLKGEVTEIESEYIYIKSAQTISLFSESGEEVVFGMKFTDNGEKMELLVGGEHLAYFEKVHYITLYKIQKNKAAAQKAVQPQNEHKSLFNDGSFLDPYLEQYYGTSNPEVLKQIYQTQQNSGYTPSSGTSTNSRPICTGCFGSGRCRACGGTGHQSHYGYSTKCSCNNGECSSCRGTGRL